MSGLKKNKNCTYNYLESRESKLFPAPSTFILSALHFVHASFRPLLFCPQKKKLNSVRASFCATPNIEIVADAPNLLAPKP